MADNYLITGYHGEPHVTTENDRGINAATFGTGRFVLPVGEQFKAEYIGNNTIRVYDGKLMDNGAAAGIPAGEYVDILIPNASQGMKRNDLIVFQYSQDASTLIESGTFVAVHGEETSGTAADPKLTQSDLLSGTATFDQMALWRVAVSGTAISAPVKMFSIYANPVNLGGTGANNAADACANIGAATVLTGEIIPSGADLNAYTTPGSYRSPSKENSSSLLNTPYTVAGFKMEVFNTNASDVFIQEIKCNSASARTYRRAGNKLSGVVEYGSWYKVMQSANDELGISDGGTGANTAVAASINLETLFLGDLTNAGHDIASGTDLNDIPVGVYRSTSANISGTLVNTPTTGTGFRLIVSKLTTASSLFQIAIQYYSGEPRIWVRIKGDIWGEWKKISFV